MLVNLLLLFLSLSGTPQTHTTRTKDRPTSTEPKTATVLIERKGKWLSSARTYWIYANGQPLCKLENRGHCQVTLPAGTTTFTTKLAGLSLVPKQQPSLSLSIEPGQRYNLQADLAVIAWPLQATLVLRSVEQ
jgi:hypothetical protein